MRKFVFCMLSIILLCLPASAFYESDDNFSNNMIEIFANLDGVPVSGLNVKLYDIGAYDTSTNTYQLDDVFVDYDSYAQDLNFADILWDGFRDTGVAVRRFGLTDSDGRIVFQSLEPGAYLIAGDDAILSGRCYTPCAGLIHIDGSDSSISTDLRVVPSDIQDARPEPDLSVGETVSNSIAVVDKDTTVFPVEDSDNLNSSNDLNNLNRSDSDISWLQVVFIIVALIVLAIFVSFILSVFDNNNDKSSDSQSNQQE